MKYRREIDGLRAMAILPVILFHAGFVGFSGGFVGVDVFFVISGYLITSIILKEKSEGTFTLIGFYERRARRILPALFVVLLCCIPLAWLSMYPKQFIDFGDSLVASSLFGSNILYWVTSDYFSGPAELKPLLHTWSLSVEEQYYLLFPLFILAVWKLGKKWILFLLSILTLVSLAIAHWGATNQPTANFYLLPTRGWELLIGVFASFYHDKKENNHHIFNKLVGDILSLLGVILIAYSVLVFDNETPFPSLWALLPTIGTVLIILFAVEDTLIGRILSHKILVGVGLISYSLYLWHWPLFAFARLNSLDEPSTLVFLSLITVTFLLAYLSWRFIESFFRKPSFELARGKIFSLSLFFMVLYTGIGLTIHNEDGFVDEFVARTTSEKKEQARLLTQYWGTDLDEVMNDDGECKFWSGYLNQDFIRRFNACKEKPKHTILVIGDSHAMNLYNILYNIPSLATTSVVGLNRGGCRISSEKCDFTDVFQFIAKNKKYIDKVIYHQSGSHFLADKNGNVDSTLAFDKSLPFTIQQETIIGVINYLNKIGELTTVLWVGPFVELRENALKFLLPETIPEINPTSIKRFDHLETTLVDLTSESKLYEYISFNSLYDIPKNFVFYDGCLTYLDKDHFSKCGERFISVNLNIDLIKHSSLGR